MRMTPVHHWAVERDKLGPRRAWLLSHTGALVWALLTEANVMDAAEPARPAADLLFDAFPGRLPRNATPEQVEARRERWEDAITRLLVVADRELESGSPLGEWIAIFARSIKVGPGVFGLAWIEWQKLARMWLRYAVAASIHGGWNVDSVRAYALTIPGLGWTLVQETDGVLCVTYDGATKVRDVEQALRMVAPRDAQFSVKHTSREAMELFWRDPKRVRR